MPHHEDRCSDIIKVSSNNFFKLCNLHDVHDAQVDLNPSPSLLLEDIIESSLRCKRDQDILLKAVENYIQKIGVTYVREGLDRFMHAQREYLTRDTDVKALDTIIKALERARKREEV